MASFECNVDLLDVGALDAIESFWGGASWTPMEKRPLRLAIIAADGTRIEADMPKSAPADAIDLLEFAWLALTYGREGEDYEGALADLRAAKTAHEARKADEGAALPVISAFTAAIALRAILNRGHLVHGDQAVLVAAADLLDRASREGKL